jgi:hypothetical protein
MPRSLRVAVAVLLPLLAAAGCQAPRAAAPSADYAVAEGYDARRPADIAVLAPGGRLPPAAAEALREALRRRLLALRYAPVRLKEIDRAPAEFRPGGKNAVLEVVVVRWDDAALYGLGELGFTGEVRLHAAGSTEVLYRGSLRDAVVDARREAHSMEDRDACVRAAAEEAAERLLAKLPVKGDG